VALLLNETGQEITEEAITSVVEAAGGVVKEARIRALTAALEDIEISDAVEEAGAVPRSAEGADGRELAGSASPLPQPIESEEEEDDGDDDEFGLAAES